MPTILRSRRHSSNPSPLAAAPLCSLHFSARSARFCFPSVQTRLPRAAYSPCVDASIGVSRPIDRLICSALGVDAPQ
ncbi:hypothetical protein PR003_g25728 [Phytophthora rubi]|uniref:Uncharacterized protein n=1 Tax=Phytophthora rubi TaxID=129364 RepID=A0A6A3I6Z8_9STRA|nr:hypothetical protein PR002_g25110 [Phytophthora rubi]KAE8978739.1 hypothetical protein PR001_g24756 [Phytophthora rubi]KAE9288750.1 hypothetical protein PR003_g25728 [Phytophthora rubi]